MIIKKIIEVCKKVYLHDYISSLPEGYNTILKENASNLSGGQKQRLAIARAFLTGAKILIFDEITSALDHDLSSKIWELIQELKKEYTILVITHKKEEFSNSDKVYRIKNKKLIEVKHSEL